jgi:tetratricopeptide (TPR) repeat protein
MTRSLASVSALLVLSASLVAQMQTRENCELSVSVRATDERSIEAPIQVEVLSDQDIRIATAHINGAEPAQFQVTNGMTYRLRVSGLGIETVNTPFFEINPLEQLHTEMVHVKLQSQTEPTQATPGSATISVSEMNIPKKAGAEMQKGLEAYSKEDIGKASDHFERAIAEYPHCARAYNMLGVIAIKNSDRIRARELFSQSIHADSTFLQAYVNLARMALQDQNYAESESMLGKALAVNPSMPDALALLATTEFATKEYDKALADVERTHALPNHEQFAEVHIMAGKTLGMQNRPDDAISQFQLFLKEKPDSPEAESVRKAIVSLKPSQQP